MKRALAILSALPDFNIWHASQIQSDKIRQVSKLITNKWQVHKDNWPNI